MLATVLRFGTRANAYLLMVTASYPTKGDKNSGEVEPRPKTRPTVLSPNGRGLLVTMIVAGAPLSSPTTLRIKATRSTWRNSACTTRRFKCRLEVPPLPAPGTDVPYHSQPARSNLRHTPSSAVAGVSGRRCPSVRPLIGEAPPLPMC